MILRSLPDTVFGSYIDLSGQSAIGLNRILRACPEWSLLILRDELETSNPSTSDPHIKTATVLFTKAIPKSLDTGTSAAAVFSLFAAILLFLFVTGHACSGHLLTSFLYG